jgi:phosphatidylserine/phosphatidylglycerophosphate/cardiolipin synthase-like enzyme
LVAKRLNHAILLLPALLLLAGTPTLAVASSSPPSPVTAEAQLLADGAYYPALLDKIRAAQKSIDLVMYLWKTSPAADNKPAALVSALGEAHRRGVGVRVILENSGYDEELNRTNRETAQLLQREGITVNFDSPAVTAHSKMAVIDRRFCFIGSHNLSQSALGRNREMSVLFDSPRLAAELGLYTDTLLGKR